MTVKGVVAGIIVIAALVVGWYLISPAFITKEVQEASPLDSIPDEEFVRDRMDEMTQEEHDEFERQVEEMKGIIIEKDEDMPSVAQLIAQGEFKPRAHEVEGNALLIDDIQFFNGKSRTQEEFFYAFNALIESHKQVVISCDTYPREMAGIENRLISRFGWGLTVAVEPPELEMRVAILLKKAEAEAVKIDEAVAFFLAKHIQSNVRELEGGLKRVLAYARFSGQEISVDLCRDALRDLLAIQNRQVSVENIQKTALFAVFCNNGGQGCIGIGKWDILIAKWEIVEDNVDK